MIDTAAAYGTYNLSNNGEPQSWADIAADVYELAGSSRDDVTGVSTAEYFKGKVAAPRPLNSAMELGKIRAAGFSPRPSREALAAYLK